MSFNEITNAFKLKPEQELNQKALDITIEKIDNKRPTPDQVEFLKDTVLMLNRQLYVHKNLLAEQFKNK